MKVAAIIAEYNPFHSGHKYQIDKVRELLGPDTAIIAIMSGNYTQRGELAIADKTVRARAAIDCGVNLVLEIPFPFSMSSAEFYAGAGVSIANSSGVVDYLVFGSECGNVELLNSIAKNMLSEQFSSALEKRVNSEAYANEGYPLSIEFVYNELFGNPGDVLSSPNNTLSLEYVKALIRSDSQIKPMTIKRVGAGYSDAYTDKSRFQSATALRNILLSNRNSAAEYMPPLSFEAFSSAFNTGLAPSKAELLDSAVISHLRLNPPCNECKIHDATGGLYNRLYDASLKVTAIKSLCEAVKTKKYTTARIMRAIWYSFLGVTSSEIRRLPAYTQVLGMDDVGRALLRRISKVSTIPVITKPSSTNGLCEAAALQKERARIADSVYMLSLGDNVRQDFAMAFVPYVKK